MSVDRTHDRSVREVTRFRRSPFVSRALLVVSILLAGCGSSVSPGGDSGPGTQGGTTTGAGTGIYSGGDQPPISTGTIAYTHGDELRLIEPDGTGDHLVWSTPASGISGVNHVVSAPAWRPNGWEIAFSSNHELAYSVFDRDIYAIRPDGVGLRRLTNAPTREQAASYPKGDVRVTVQNLGSSGSSFSIIVQGADPQPIEVALGTQETITVKDVADLGGGVAQGIVVVSGTYRWLGPTVDVRAGQTVDAAGVLQVDGYSTSEAFGAGAPFWRSDSSKVGYVGPFCRLLQVASNPAPGFVYQDLVSRDAFFDTCPGEWGPTAATADQLIAPDRGVYADTSVMNLLRMKEGAATKSAPVFSLDPFIQVVDLHWSRDGSGFLFARRNSQLEYDVNVWQYEFATGTTTQLTNVEFANGKMQRFSMSPDGSRIAFEMVDKLYGDDPFLGSCDLWVMNRDGSGQKLLAKGAAYPAWNPVR